MRVHRQYYRLQDDVLQTSKLAKVFLLMDNGNLPQQKGKTMDEITQLLTNGDEISVGKLLGFLCLNPINFICFFWSAVVPLRIYSLTLVL